MRNKSQYLVGLLVNNSFQQGELQRCSSGSILQLFLKKACRARSVATPRETGVCPCEGDGRDGRGVEGRDEAEEEEEEDGRGVEDAGDDGLAKRARCTRR